jgi:glycine/D-amino acid oxidase-like deaminating enzyme
MQKSIWTQNISFPSFPPLSGETRTDVLIIGGGMAGQLCAFQLKQAGVDTLVIEAARIGGGVTSGTTAKLTSQHGLIYHKLLRQIGPEKTRLYWQIHQRALAEYRRLSEVIPCDFETQDNFIYTRADRDILDAELDALYQLKIPAEFADSLPLPISTAGAVCFRQQGRFHPLKFLSGIAKDLNIRENTRALKIEKGRVITNRGVIRAEKIIVATHFPIYNRRGLYFMKQYQDRSYAIALTGAADLGGMYLDGSGKGFSFRNQGDLLILGGGSHRTGKPSSGWEPLSAFALAHYPGVREVSRWAAQDCMTLDGLPYIGQYSPGTPWLYVATGFNKWGMTGSMAAAMILRDQILGRENVYGEIFDPSRSMLHPKLAANLWESTVNLVTPTRPRCPHLGCVLKWNPQEHSWDCPCHGSRFTESGAVMESPAVKRMKKDR